MHKKLFTEINFIFILRYNKELQTILGSNHIKELLSVHQVNFSVECSHYYLFPIFILFVYQVVYIYIYKYGIDI